MFNDVNLLVAMPVNSYNIVNKKTKKSIQELIFSDIKCKFEFTTGSMISKQRNILISGKNINKIQNPLTDRGFTHILFVDSDIEFKIKNVRQLLSRMNKDNNIHIISGAYKRKRDNDYTAGFWDGNIKGKLGIDIELNAKGLHIVDWVGGGFLLIDAFTFTQLQYPYFQWRVWETENESDECGEDQGFCWQAQEKGFNIYLDADCKVEHLI